MDFVNELLQVSGIRGHEFDLSANFIPLVIRSAVFVVCLMVTVRVIHVTVEFLIKTILIITSVNDLTYSFRDANIAKCQHERFGRFQVRVPEFNSIDEMNLS